MTANLYWNNKGKFQELADKLQTLVPQMGECWDVKANKKLDRYRRAVNCYYDLYNNGLCNRGRQFAAIFKMSKGDAEFCPADLEAKMDEIIMDAAVEQLGNTNTLQNAVDRVMRKTGGAYSRTRYGDDVWHSTIADLLTYWGLTEVEAYHIMTSKWTRWAADAHENDDLSVPKWALSRYMQDNGIRGEEAMKQEAAKCQH